MKRVLLDMNTLDQVLREDLERVDSAETFHVALWRHEPDASGANWDAYVTRFHDNRPSNIAWWDVVPRLRSVYSLIDENN